MDKGSGKFTVLLDNGHGAGTPGKRSPDGRLKEYRWARETASLVALALRGHGVDARLLVPEEEDVPLRERVARANAACRERGKDGILLVSVHVNAAGNGKGWHQASGWQACVSRNASAASRRLAACLCEAAEERGLKVRRHTEKEPWWPQNLAICRDTPCPAVLTENLFMDNRADADYLLSERGRLALAEVHADGIADFIGMKP